MRPHRAKMSDELLEMLTFLTCNGNCGTIVALNLNDIIFKCFLMLFHDNCNSIGQHCGLHCELSFVNLML
jgi:hypothetical protein